ncbi:unnamed protein product [Symbiodinium natans]|uniref:GH16 domain-containing protein n=1 Tax=Symbiodinium natans TaxID=878477 RepID=A0A812Q0C4_9DINO|nr:unnamed protein product [Symbiodinium natans]
MSWSSSQHLLGFHCALTGCAKTAGCAHFSWWTDKGCVIQDSSAVFKPVWNVVAGPPQIVQETITCAGKISPAETSWEAIVSVKDLLPSGWSLKFKMRLQHKFATAAAFGFKGTEGNYGGWLVLDTKIDSKYWMLTEGPGGSFEGDKDRGDGSRKTTYTHHKLVGESAYTVNVWHDWEISMWEQFLTVSMDGRMIYAHPASEYFPIREIVLRPWRNAMDVYGLELQRLEAIATVLSTNNKVHPEGLCFNFNKVDLRLVTPKGGKYYKMIVTRCRKGAPPKKGLARIFPSVNGGSVGDAHGRWDSGYAAGDWRVGDLVVTGSCP